MATIAFKVNVETAWEVISFPAAVTESKISNKMLLNYIQHCYNESGLDLSDDEIEKITLLAVNGKNTPYVEQLPTFYFWPTYESRKHTDLSEIYRSDSPYKLFS